jgi:hypothetical protein
MAENIKISALSELVSGSIAGTTIVPVVDGGVTLKTQMSSIKAFTNSDVATDTELTNAVSALNNTINSLTTTNISEGTRQYYTDVRVQTKIDSLGILSGSLPATFNLGVIGGGTSVSNVDSITFYGTTVNDNGSGDIDVSINSGSLTVINGGTNIPSVNTINLSGGTLTNNGGGDVTIGLGSFTVEDIAGDSISDVTKLNFDGISSLSNDGNGEVTVTIATPAATDLTSLNTFTGSIDGRVTTIEGLEIDNTSLNTFTGSFSSSVEGRVTTLENAGGGGGSVDGTISGSQQITDFGFVSSSRAFDGLGLVSIISASNDPGETIQIQVTPGAGGGGDVSYEDGFHIISQSSTLPGESNIILTDIKLGTGLQDFKFIDFSESLDSRFGSGGGSDYISNVVFSENQLTFTGQNNAFNGVVPLSEGIISSSLQITNFGFLQEADIVGVLPQGTISGSTQIVESGFVTNDSTASLALSDNISGSFTQLSASIASDIAGISGVSETTLGDVTASILNGGAFDGEGNPITLISSSTQVSYSNLNGLPYFIGDGVSITSGSDVESIPYFNLSAGISDYILAHTASLNYHSASISASVDSLVVDSGSFSIRVTAVEVSSGTARFDSLEARTGSVDNSINELNTFTGSFSSSVAQRFEDVEGAGGGADYVSNVVLDGTNLNFTGQGSAFNNTVDLSSLSTGGVTEASYGLISQSYDKSSTNIEIGGAILGGASGNVTLSTISQSFDTRISAFSGVTELSGLTDVGTITVDVAEGDILVYDSVAQEFTHSQDLTGNYKITGSIDTKGSINVSGSVTADSFVAGDVGTPIISAATLLEINAGNNVSITAGAGGLILSSSADVRVNHMLTLEKTIGNPSASPLTGSMMNSGSIDSDSKLWFFNGTEWKEIAFV